MIGYTLFGTNDLPKAAAFYDELLGVIGAQKAPGTDRIIIWSTGAGAMFGVCEPADGNPATRGNGTMVALTMPDRATVDAIYQKAMELGASCAGEPGTTENSDTFYGAYIRDSDNNKLCFYHM